MEKEVAKYNNCFVCGSDNPIGLNLKFLWDGEICRTRYLPADAHEGYKGILHGGLIATILDEVMIKAALAQDILCVTAKMEIKFKAPASVDHELLFEGKITEQKGRLLKTSGRVIDQSGQCYAEAVATYVVARPEMEEKLRESLD